MEISEKVFRLAEGSKYDNCASSASSRKSFSRDRIGNAAASGICHAFTEDGRCVSLYKTLMANTCNQDCRYCQNAVGCKKTPVAFTPDELSKVFMNLYMRNYVEGLFITSSVVKDADHTMDKMLESVRILREKFKYQGYVHFKVMPGASKDKINEASEYADRMSINLEAPSKNHLNEISSTKDFKIDILRRQSWIKHTGIPAGQTTQLVVGANDATDLDHLRMVDWEYRNFSLKRAYYSAFEPVKDTALEHRPGVPLDREHRLYNVDFMLRKYGIRLDEFKSIMEDGNLPRGDPKVHLARSIFDSHVDINEASYDELIRIPGIGPMSARRIISLQEKNRRITKREQLKDIGVAVKRAFPFIEIEGKRQMSLGEFA